LLIYGGSRCFRANGNTNAHAGAHLMPGVLLR